MKVKVGRGSFPFVSATLRVGLSSIDISLSPLGGVTGLTGVVGAAPKVNVVFGASVVVEVEAAKGLGVAGGAGEGVLPKVNGAAFFSVVAGGAGDGDDPKAKGAFGASGAGELDGCCPKLKAGALVPKRGFGASIVGAAGAAGVAAGAPKVNVVFGGSADAAGAGAAGAREPKRGAGLGVLARGLASGSFGASTFGAPKEKGNEVDLGASACDADVPNPKGCEGLGAVSAGASAGLEGAPKLKPVTGATEGVEGAGSAGLGAPKENGAAGAVVAVLVLAGAPAGVVDGAPNENPPVAGAEPNEEDEDGRVNADGLAASVAVFSTAFSFPLS